MAKRKSADDATEVPPASSDLRPGRHREVTKKQSSISDFVHKKRTPQSSKYFEDSKVAVKKPRVSRATESKDSSDEASAAPNAGLDEPRKDAPSGIDSTRNSPRSQSVGTLSISEETGDLFASPPSTLLIHACNSQGTWGAGIAAAFKSRYPLAFARYNSYCQSQKRLKTDLSGTALLIPPLDQGKGKGNHFIGCLFTSRGKGWTKDSPERILSNTGPAMEDLLKQMRDWNEAHSAPSDGKAAGVGEKCEKDGASSDSQIGGIWMCKINSGLFNVPWGKSKAVLEAIEVDEEMSVTVVEKE